MAIHEKRVTIDRIGGSDVLYQSEVVLEGHAAVESVRFDVEIKLEAGVDFNTARERAVRRAIELLELMIGPA